MLQRLQSGTLGSPLQPCLSLEEVHAIREGVAKISVSDALQRYILALVRTTREDKQITLGVSPRGAVALQKAVQALTYLEGRTYPEPDDIKWLAPAVLSHRLIPASGQSRVQIVKRLLDTVPIP
jgi:MoxR-like ATPase